MASTQKTASTRKLGAAGDRGRKVKAPPRARREPPDRPKKVTPHIPGFHADVTGC